MREFDDLPRWSRCSAWDKQTTSAPRGGGPGAAAATLRVSTTGGSRPAPRRAARTRPTSGPAASRGHGRMLARTLATARCGCQRVRAADGVAAMPWIASGAAPERPRLRLFRPWLEEIVELKREEAELVGHDGEPYDALLDEYEPGMTRRPAGAAARASCATSSDRLLGEIRDPSRGRRRPFAGRLPADASGTSPCGCCRDIGFDLEAGRQDMLGPPVHRRRSPSRDVRLTTRFDDGRPGPRGLRHDARGRPRAVRAGLRTRRYEGTPIGQAASLGMHESQSRLWRTGSGRSRAFWEHCYPRDPGASQALGRTSTPTTSAAQVNRVQPTLIRVEADEVTYNLHILLRFELELALIASEVEVADLPGGLERGVRALPRRRARRTTARACCRTSTGRAARSATSRPTRSATVRGHAVGASGARPARHRRRDRRG